MIFPLPPFFFPATSRVTDERHVTINNHTNNYTMKKKKVNEATLEDERALLSVAMNKKDAVKVRNRTYHIGWMHLGIGDWISDLIVNKADNKLLAKSAALIVLNGFWKAHLFYWFLWRWFYYVKQYTAAELKPLFELAQKKTFQEEKTAYLSDMILLTALNTTRKQMTMEEAKRILREHPSDSDGK